MSAPCAKVEDGILKVDLPENAKRVELWGARDGTPATLRVWYTSGESEWWLCVRADAVI